MERARGALDEDTYDVGEQLYQLLAYLEGK